MPASEERAETPPPESPASSGERLPASWAWSIDCHWRGGAQPAESPALTGEAKREKLGKETYGLRAHRPVLPVLGQIPGLPAKFLQELELLEPAR